MKNLLIAGYVVTGFSLAQLLSFVAISYPTARLGSVLLLLAIAASILIVGLANWVGLQLKQSKNGLVLGFAPAIAIGLIFLIAVACGLYIGMYGG